MKFRSLLLLIIGIVFCNVAFTQNMTQAKELYQQKQYDKAFDIFKSAKRGSANYADSRYYMGLISYIKQDYSKAEDYLKQAIESNGNVAKYHVAIKNVYLRLISSAGMLKQASLASKLRQHMEEAVRLNPNDMSTSIMLVGFYKQAPSIMGGSSDNAIALANKIAGINKADGHLANALISHIDKDYDKAEKHYKSTVSVCPDSVKYYYSLAQFYQSQKKPEVAVSVLEQAISRFPENNNLMLQVGRVFATAEQIDFSKGIDYLERYIKSVNDKSDITLGDAYYYLGLIEKNRNNKHLAIPHFNNALRINPNHRWAKEVLDEIK